MAKRLGTNGRADRLPEPREQARLADWQGRAGEERSDLMGVPPAYALRCIIGIEADTLGACLPLGGARPVGQRRKLPQGISSVVAEDHPHG
jgi:hypothetical protein